MKYFISPIYHRVIYKFTDKLDLKYYANTYLRHLGIFKSLYDDEVVLSENPSNNSNDIVEESYSLREVPMKHHCTIVDSKNIITSKNFEKREVPRQLPAAYNPYTLYIPFNSRGTVENKNDEYPSYEVHLVNWNPNNTEDKNAIKNNAADISGPPGGPSIQGVPAGIIKTTLDENEQLFIHQDNLQDDHQDNPLMDEDAMLVQMMGNILDDDTIDLADITDNKQLLESTKSKKSKSSRKPLSFILSPSHLLINSHIINWKFVSRHCSMNMNQLYKLKDHIDWDYLIQCQIVPWNIISAFLSYINITYVAMRYKVPSIFIRENIHRLSRQDCTAIITFQYVDEDIITQYIDKFDISVVLKYQKMSMNFINKHLLKCNFQLLYTYQTLDSTFIRKYHRDLNIKHLLYTSDIPEDILQIYLDNHTIIPIDLARYPYIPLSMLSRYLSDTSFAEMLETSLHQLKKIRLIYCPNMPQSADICDSKRVNIDTLYIGRNSKGSTNIMDPLVLDLQQNGLTFSEILLHQSRRQMLPINRSRRNGGHISSRGMNFGGRSTRSDNRMYPFDIDDLTSMVYNNKQQIDRQKTSDLAEFQAREEYYNNLSADDKKLHDKIYNKLFNDFLYDPSMTNLSKSKVLPKLSYDTGVTFVENPSVSYDINDPINYGDNSFVYASLSLNPNDDTADTTADDADADKLGSKKDIRDKITNMMRQKRQIRNTVDDPNDPDPNATDNTIQQSSISRSRASRMNIRNALNDSIENPIQGQGSSILNSNHQTPVDSQVSLENIVLGNQVETNFHNINADTDADTSNADLDNYMRLSLNIDDVPAEQVPSNLAEPASIPPSSIPPSSIPPSSIPPSIQSSQQSSNRDQQVLSVYSHEVIHELSGVTNDMNDNDFSRIVAHNMRVLTDRNTQQT